MKHATHRRGSVYVAVVATVASVSVLTLAGVSLRKSFHERARTGVDIREAHRAARSAAELAAYLAYDDPADFRARATTGTLFADLRLGESSISAIVLDADTDAGVTDTTEHYRVIADATHGSARSRIAMSFERSASALGEIATAEGAYACWTMNEERGSSVIDETEQGHAGVYHDTSEPGFTTHPDGGPAPYFDATSPGASVPHHAAFELDEGTMVFWMNVVSFPTLRDSAGIIVKEEPTKDASAHFAVYLNRDGDLIFSMYDQSGNGGQVEVAGVITERTWHHVSVSWGSKLRVYIDGTPVTTDATIKIGLAADGAMAANTSDWRFGVRNKSYFGVTPSRPLNGSLCRVALFDSELKLQEVQDLMKASGLPGGIALVEGSFDRVTD